MQSLPFYENIFPKYPVILYVLMFAQTLTCSQVLTKDSVTVSVDGVVYYRVQNATLAVANITNADAATRLLAQTTLRNVLGTKNLAEILSDREEIAHTMQVGYSNCYTCLITYISLPHYRNGYSPNQSYGCLQLVLNKCTARLVESQ